jgi:hypothetical protein
LGAFKSSLLARSESTILDCGLESLLFVTELQLFLLLRPDGCFLLWTTTSPATVADAECGKGCTGMKPTVGGDRSPLSQCNFLERQSTGLRHGLDCSLLPPLPPGTPGSICCPVTWLPPWRPRGSLCCYRMWYWSPRKCHLKSFIASMSE